MTLTAVTASRMLRLDVVCPRCRTRPRVRVAESEQGRYAGDPPDLVVLTYECHGRRPGEPRCDERYPITAKAFQRAS